MCICPSLFEKKSQQSKVKHPRESPTSFKHRWFMSCGEIKPPTPVLLTVHFSAALKTFVLGNLFKVFRLDITFAREVCHLGIKMKKIWQSSYSFIIPSGKLPGRMWWQILQDLTSLNKLPNTRVFVAAENGSVEVLELVALFLHKTWTIGA